MFLLKLLFWWQLLQIFATVKSMRILVAGDYNTDFFEHLASSISGDGKHTVVKLSRKLDPIFKHKKEDGVTWYGIGRHLDKFV